MELMRHSDPRLTAQFYTDAGMLPIWDPVGALPMFNDTQIDTQDYSRTVKARQVLSCLTATRRIL